MQNFWKIDNTTNVEVGGVQKIRPTQHVKHAKDNIKGWKTDFNLPADNWAPRPAFVAIEPWVGT